MKGSAASQSQSTSELISKRIAELGDWRGEILSRRWRGRGFQRRYPRFVRESQFRGSRAR